MGNKTTTVRNSVIRTIEVGYGSVSLVADDDLTVITFKSIVHAVESHNVDITSGSMNSAKNVIVDVEGKYYEVGPDIDKIYDPRHSRVLNSDYINSDQYKALFLGGLSMMKLGPDNVIDFLIGGLPVSNMRRRDELISFMEGDHIVNGRTITVKKAWAAAQPLGGLFSHANDEGESFLATMNETTILTVDAGYFTVDFLTTTGMHVSDTRSGAIEKGMSKVIESVSGMASPIFGTEKVFTEIIDKAFYGEEKSLKFKGKHYPFPVCKKKDTFGKDCRFNYDFNVAIERVTKEACSFIQNAVGDAQDVDLILIVGGPAEVYKRSLIEAFPDHRIKIVKPALQAVCIGLHVAGINKFQALENSLAA